MKMETPEPAKTSIQVIERMVALLDALASYPDPVSLKELSKVSGLHPSTAHRILNDMVVTRFVDRVEPGTYRLGMRLLELGNVVKSRLSVREAAVDLMRALHNKTRQTVNLSVRQGDEIVYIDRAFSERSGMQVVRAIGGRGPLHLTSTGKLFLSVDEPKAIRAYATRTGLAGHNKNSITDLARLERELSLVRARGYARDNEELELGVRCMAAGIHDDSGKLVAGLSISAPADRLQEEWLEDLVNTAAQISATLGHRPVRGLNAPARLHDSRRRIAARADASYCTTGAVAAADTVTGTPAAAAAGIVGRLQGFQPLAHAAGIRRARHLALRIQEHHDHVAALDHGLHHQAAPRFVDEAGLLQADVPVRHRDQVIGVVVLQSAGRWPGPRSSGRSCTGAAAVPGAPTTTSLARSRALDTFWLDRPFEST